MTRYRRSARVPAEDRFWAKVQKGEGCWEWTGARREQGYGAFMQTGGKIVTAHRHSWELAHGPVPEGVLVLHSCDNPPCVNPAHLRLGTHAENTADMDARGRRPARSRALLTEIEVREIRQWRAKGHKLSTLAAAFGVSPIAIHLVVTRKTWKHVL